MSTNNSGCNVHQQQHLQPCSPLAPHIERYSHGPRAVTQGLKAALGMSMPYPHVQGWDLRFGSKEPTLLQPGPPPPGRLARSCRAPRRSCQGQLHQHWEVGKSDRRPHGSLAMGPSLLPQPQGHVPGSLLLPGLGPLGRDHIQSRAQGGLSLPRACRYHTNTEAKG